MTANQILLKLGGIPFMCQTGANNFQNGPGYLQFDLPGGRTCRIDPIEDTYAIKVYSSQGDISIERDGISDLRLFFSRHVH